jgi:hypothetical protein
MAIDRSEAGRRVQILAAQAMRQAEFGHHNHVTNYIHAGVNSRRGPIRFYRLTRRNARNVRRL